MKTSSLSLLGALAVGAAMACNVTTIAPPDGTNPQPPGPTSQPVFSGQAIQADTPPPPIAGGSLIVVKQVSGPALAVVSDPDEDVIDVVSLGSSPAVVGSIQLQPGDEPGRLVADAQGHVHVALRRGGSVATIDPASHSLMMRREVCAAPRGVDYDAASDSIYVACATGELVQLPALGGAPTRTLHLDRDLRDVVVQGTTIYVTRFRSAETLYVDASTGNVKQRTMPGTSTIDPSQPTPEVAWRALPGQGAPVLLHQLASTTPINVATPPGQSSYGGSTDQFNGPSSGGGVVVMAFGGGNQVSTPLAFNPAVDMAVASGGRTGYAILSLQGVVHFTTGSMDWAIPQTTTSFDSTAAFISIVDSGDAIVVQQRSPSPVLWVMPMQGYNFSDAVSVALPQHKSHQDTGFDVFHIPTAAGVACMNCHPEGGDDGHVWQFQNDTSVRARRTQSLHGGVISDSAPYHWDGDMSDLQKLCDEVFTHRMGGGSLATNQTPILARWLGAIPRIGQRADLDPVKVASGEALFNGQGACAGCHVGGRGTLPSNADIGKTDILGQTRSLQVPMLVDVADRAPYMHDGCAKTLLQRFTDPACSGNAHGNTAQFTDTDRANLVEYLESL